MLYLTRTCTYYLVSIFYENDYILNLKGDPMDFLDVAAQRKQINTASKTLITQYEDCPLRTYKHLRDTDKTSDHSRLLDIGILGHDIAASAASDILQGSYEPTTENFPLEVVYEVNEEIRDHVNFKELLADQSLIGIEEKYTVSFPEVSEDFNLIVKNDLTTYREIKGIPYTVIYEWKTGYNIKMEVDAEAILYALAAYKKYGLPVIFIRLGLRNGKRFPKVFSIDSLEDIQPDVVKLLKRYKRDMEDEFSPEFNPGSHCQHCKYIAQCDGRKYIGSLRHKLKASIWAKELAKHYEKEVKAAAQLVLEKDGKPGVGEVTALLPFLDGKYGAVAKTSSSFQLKTRKVKKAEIMDKILEVGAFAEYAPFMELKFNEEVAAKLESDFEIPFKEVIRTTISIQEVEEGAEDE